MSSDGVIRSLGMEVNTAVRAYNNAISQHGYDHQSLPELQGAPSVEQNDLDRFKDNIEAFHANLQRRVKYRPSVRKAYRQLQQVFHEFAMAVVEYEVLNGSTTKNDYRM